MVILAQLTLAPIVGASPSGFLDGVSGELVKSLPQKLGASPAEVDRLGAAAALGHRSNTGVVLQLSGVLVTLALGAEGGDQAWPQDWASSGQPYKSGSPTNKGASGWLLAADSMR